MIERNFLANRLPWSRFFGNIFVRNELKAVNFCKKCGWLAWMRWKKITAFHSISFKHLPQNSPLVIQTVTASNVVANWYKNCVERGGCGEKKLIHRFSSHFLQKIAAEFTSFLTKFHRICFPWCLWNLIWIHGVYHWRMWQMEQWNKNL